MIDQIRFQNSKNQTLSGVIHRTASGKGAVRASADRGQGGSHEEARAADGKTAEGRNQPWVILCHGMFSSKEGTKMKLLAERLVAAGLNALRFDFTSCGESEGEKGSIVYSQQVADISSAVDSLEEAYAPSRICLVGSSMGAATVILYAAKRPYKLSGLVLIAAPSDTLLYVKENFSEDQLKEWEKAGVWVDENHVVQYDFYPDAQTHDILESAKLLHLPTLVVHGKKDALVKVACATEIFNALPYTKGLVLLEKGDHPFSRVEDRERVVRLAVEWCVAYS